MHANVRWRRTRSALSRVTPDVPVCVLGYPSLAPSFHPHISTVNEAHPIALVGVELCQGALETDMVWARSIRRLARLQTRQKLDETSLYLREIRVPRYPRRTCQSRRQTRIPPKRPFVSPWLPTPRKRNCTQPSPVFPLTIRAGLDRRVDVSAACEGGQCCREVRDVLLEGIGNCCGKVGRVVRCVGIRGSGERYRPRYPRAVG